MDDRPHGPRLRVRDAVQRLLVGGHDAPLRRVEDEDGVVAERADRRVVVDPDLLAERPAVGPRVLRVALPAGVGHADDGVVVGAAVRVRVGAVRERHRRRDAAVEGYRDPPEGEGADDGVLVREGVVREDLRVADHVVVRGELLVLGVEAAERDLLGSRVVRVERDELDVTGAGDVERDGEPVGRPPLRGGGCDDTMSPGRWKTTRDPWRRNSLMS